MLMPLSGSKRRLLAKIRGSDSELSDSFGKDDMVQWPLCRKKEASMLQCSFELNNKPMSTFQIGAVISVPAFSGLAPHVNRRNSACLPDLGPIPFGKYFIVDRESGGRLGQLYDFFSNRADWFSLYAADEKVDDETFCNQVKRGHFRLHAKGVQGISKGCIVVNSPPDFNRVRHLLTSSGKHPIPGSALLAYGMVTVK
jgi:hypothetical protein